MREWRADKGVYFRNGSFVYFLFNLIFGLWSQRSILHVTATLSSTFFFLIFKPNVEGTFWSFTINIRCILTTPQCVRQRILGLGLGFGPFSYGPGLQKRFIRKHVGSYRFQLFIFSNFFIFFNTHFDSLCFHFFSWKELLQIMVKNSNHEEEILNY